MVATIPNYDKWHEVEWLRAERNAVANKMKGKLEPSVHQALVGEGKNLKEGLIALVEDLVQLTDKLQLEAQSIPNTTHPDVHVSGSKFYYLKNEAVLLEMALVNWAITEVSSLVEKCGFQPRAQSTQCVLREEYWFCQFSCYRRCGAGARRVSGDCEHACALSMCGQIDPDSKMMAVCRNTCGKSYAAAGCRRPTITSSLTAAV
ncbi:hypothetical protein E2562_008090 [Oryza meyeriana var. granulata]|uniref:Serine-tRNA synthetase type1 N-terminal domain-containing protein n=1 Tax=Oryza meyeriana var. granulata TaxID=110450 RepID=A0A6G1CE75_9ORYZ|nr:hypothetical protein E2562_008090 [Oryza meyeriana var. granulata]